MFSFLNIRKNILIFESIHFMIGKICNSINKGQNLQNNEQHKIIKSSGIGNKDKDKNGNILMRFYKRYVMDSNDQNNDCDNFSKL